MDRSRENKSKLKQSQLYLGTGPEPKEVRLKFKDARTKARLKAYVFLDRLLSIFTQRYVCPMTRRFGWMTVFSLE